MDKGKVLEFKVDDKVRDTTKMPGPGETADEGRVVSITFNGNVIVRWANGYVRTYTHQQATSIFVLLDRREDDG